MNEKGLSKRQKMILKIIQNNDDKIPLKDLVQEMRRRYHIIGDKWYRIICLGSGKKIKTSNRLEQRSSHWYEIKRRRTFDASFSRSINRLIKRNIIFINKKKIVHIKKDKKKNVNDWI